MVSTNENANPLRRLGAQGQSVWLDYIRRDLIDTGELARLVREDGVRGQPRPQHACADDRIAGSADPHLYPLRVSCP